MDKITSGVTIRYSSLNGKDTGLRYLPVFEDIV